MTTKLNGSTKYFLAVISLIILAVGWGATWGVLDNKVDNLNEHTAILNIEKLDVDVYESNQEKLQLQIDSITKSQERIEAKLNKILDG